jgi:hypothetical protein
VLLQICLSSLLKARLPNTYCTIGLQVRIDAYQRPPHFRPSVPATTLRVWGFYAICQRQFSLEASRVVYILYNSRTVDIIYRRLMNS